MREKEIVEVVDSRDCNYVDVNSDYLIRYTDGEESWLCEDDLEDEDIP